MVLVVPSLTKGFVPNSTKSVWQPVQILEYLGVLLDSKKGILSIPGKRLRKCFDTIADIFARMKVHRCVQARKREFCRSGYFHVGYCGPRCIEHDALDQY